MDLAVYISELLGLQGEVNVPGMGSFAQIRINGYFDEREKKFYPPAHEVTFKLQSKEDDQLATYIADKKNISLASAKYFIEKYVTGTKHEAETKEVVIDGLGYLYTHGSILTFKGDIKKVNDPAFFGLPPVNAYQPGEKPAVVYTPPVTEEKVEEPVVEVTPVKEVIEDINKDVPPTIIEREEQEEEYQEEYVDEQPRRRINTGVILLMFIIIVILALTGVYIYKPSVIEGIIDKIHSEPARKTPIVTTPQVIKKDSTKPAVAAPDTVAKTTAPVAAAQQAAPQVNVIDSTKSRFEVMAGSFKTQKAADLAIKNFKILGVDAKVVTDAPGRLIKLSIGTFATREEAEAARIELIKTKRVSKTIYPLEIKPKK